jgi:hypothetical protein
MASQSERKVLESLTAALACCNMLSDTFSEAEPQINSAREIMAKILKLYPCKLTRADSDRAIERIFDICENILFMGDQQKIGYAASVVNFALYLLEDRYQELSEKSRSQERIRAFDDAIRKLHEVYSAIVPEDDPDFEIAEEIGKEAYKKWSS